jgi:hypothetical protein
MPTTYTNFPGESFAPQRLRDNLGKIKFSQSQNLFEADFEYSLQKMRWEVLTAGSGLATHLPGQGGVQMTVTGASGDVAMRQTRPYHRYQPGKAMYMCSGIVFGAAYTNQRQRVGFFDDANGVFWEQGDPTATNPSGIGVVYRSDIGGVPVDVRTELPQFNDPNGVVRDINWSKIQMVWVEYAWYGAGVLRWGVTINGEPFTLHQFGAGNNLSIPWARTGNLPVRYELRNIGATTAGSMTHYGVSVLSEGKIDDQRGFTYGYGAAARNVAASSTRIPILNIRYRVMGTLEYGVDANYSGSNGNLPAGGAAITGTPTTTTMTVSGTPWTAGQWVGRYVYFRTQGSIGRITANTSNTLTYEDNVFGGAISSAPVSGANYVIGIINRGQVLPIALNIYSSQNCTLELISSVYDSPVTLTGATFNTAFSAGSKFSFVEKDVAATALSGGEVVYSTPLPQGGLQNFDLSHFFPLYNNIRGNQPDILTVAITTGASAANVAASLIAQESMS